MIRRDHDQMPDSVSQPTSVRLLTVVEAAHFLNLSPGSLYHLISQKRIPVIRISSRCVRFSLVSLFNWVDSLTHLPGGDCPSQESSNRPKQLLTDVKVRGNEHRNKELA